MGRRFVDLGSLRRWAAARVPRAALRGRGADGAAGRRRLSWAARWRRALWWLRLGALAGGLAAIAGLAGWLWSALTADRGERLEVGAGDPLPGLLREIEAGTRPAGWIVAPGGVELRAEPRADAAATGQLRVGAPVAIRSEEDGWAQVQAHPDGAIGWVPSPAIGTSQQAVGAPR